MNANSIDMKILLADSNHPVLYETLQKHGYECDHFWDKSKEELIRLLPHYHGLIIRSKFKLSAELLDTCIHMKCIGRVGAGMENIDVAYAESLGIKCVHVPEGNMDALGEHALGMLLMLLNNLKKADAEVREGIWIRAENRGRELKHMTVGIIGYGYMGSSFAAKLKGIGCEVLAYDKYKSGFGDKYVQEVSLAQIFERADVVSLHVPLTAETKYMVNQVFLNAFKKPVYVMNTARGKCLNTADLVQAMREGKVQGACLDVLEYETVSFENIDKENLPEPFQYLVKSNNTILTPHIAGWTHDSNYKMSKLIAEKMVKVLSEKRS